jgi:hypothetical protein
VDDRCFFDDCEGPFVFREKCKKKLPSKFQIVEDENKAGTIINRITSMVEEKNKKALEGFSVSKVGFDNKVEKEQSNRGRGNVPKEVAGSCN